MNVDISVIYQTHIALTPLFHWGFCGLRHAETALMAIRRAVSGPWDFRSMAADTHETGAAAPFGAVGSETATACRCGAGPHPEIGGRCAAGHMDQGNGLALVVGQHSAAFWREHIVARRELREAVIADAGHTEADAPRALAIAAESIAQATLVRDSAYLRLAEAGGPLTSSGRVRRAFAVWCQAVDRLERHLRLVGLRRVPKPAPSSFAEALAQAPEVR